MSQFQFFLPTRILFGVGCIDDIAETPHLPEGGKALVVIGSAGAMIAQGYVQKLQSLLGKRGVQTILADEPGANPDSAQVDAVAARAVDSGADYLVALGGGSTIDAAKAAALTATNGGDYWALVPSGSGGGRTPEHKPLPVVAVPTTAGTGTEADPWFVVSKAGGREKIGWGTDDTYPALAVVDPALTLSAPPRLTAATGLDAFFHAAESFVALPSQPIGDMLGLEAAHLVSHALPRAVAHGDDLEARTLLSWASTAAGFCESVSSVTAMHSLEHALSAFAPELPHGVGLAALARPFFAWLAEHGGEAACGRMADLAQAMGAEQPSPEAFLEALGGLLDAVGLGAVRLADHGLNADMAAELADNAEATMGGLFEVTPGKFDRRAAEAVLASALDA